MLSLMALSGTETGPVASTLGLRPAVDVTEPCAERSTARRADTRIHRSFLALYAQQNRAKLHTAWRFGRDDQADAWSLESREKSKTPRSASSENRLEIAEGDIAVRTVTRPRLTLFLPAPESHQRCRDRCRGKAAFMAPSMTQDGWDVAPSRRITALPLSPSSTDFISGRQALLEGESAREPMRQPRTSIACEHPFPANSCARNTSIERTRNPSHPIRPN